MKDNNYECDMPVIGTSMAGYFARQLALKHPKSRITVIDRWQAPASYIKLFLATNHFMYVITRIAGTALALSLVFVNAITHASEPTKQPTDLLTLYFRAMDYDPELQAEAANRRAGEEALPQARSSLLPSISLSAEYGRFERRTQKISGIAPTREDHFSRQILQANLNQPIINLQAWYQYGAGKSRYRQAKAEYRDAIQALGERLITAYFRVLRAQSNHATRQAERVALQRQQNQVHKQLQAGIASRIDVLEVNAEASRVAVEFVKAKSQLDQSIRALETMTGERISSISSLQRIPARLELGPISSLKAKAEANNPQLLLAQYEIDTSQQSAKAAKAAHFPVLSLDLNAQRDVSGSAELTPPGTRDLTTDTTSAALRVDMPLFSGGRTSSQQREAAHLLEHARQRFRLVREEVLGELETLVETLYTQYQAIVAAQHAVSAQETALEAAQRGHEAGVRDLVDILRARREQFAAIDVLNDAKYEYVTTLARLYRLTGDLNQQQIKQFNNWLATP